MVRSPACVSIWLGSLTTGRSIHTEFVSRAEQNRISRNYHKANAITKSLLSRLGVSAKPTTYADYRRFGYDTISSDAPKRVTCIRLDDHGKEWKFCPLRTSRPISEDCACGICSPCYFPAFSQDSFENGCVPRPGRSILQHGRVLQRDFSVLDHGTNNTPRPHPPLHNLGDSAVCSVRTDPSPVEVQASGVQLGTSPDPRSTGRRRGVGKRVRTRPASPSIVAFIAACPVKRRIRDCRLRKSQEDVFNEDSLNLCSIFTDVFVVATIKDPTITITGNRAIDYCVRNGTAPSELTIRPIGLRINWNIFGFPVSSIPFELPYLLTAIRVVFDRGKISSRVLI